MIYSHEYPQVPPKVKYSLTELGLSLMPVLDAICRWGHDHVPEEETLLSNLLYSYDRQGKMQDHFSLKYKLHCPVSQSATPADRYTQSHAEL